MTSHRKSARRRRSWRPLDVCYHEDFPCCGCDPNGPRGYVTLGEDLDLDDLEWLDR